MPDAARSDSMDHDLHALADALRSSVLRLARRVRQEAGKVGLSPLDALILAKIRQQPGIGVCDLAELEQVSRPTMSAHAKRLEAAGLIRRSDHDADRRRSGLAVTAAAVRKLDALKRQRTDWLAGRLQALDEAERAQLSQAAIPLAKMAGLDR